MTHKPNDISRQTVQRMASYGLRQSDISKYMGVSEKTLRKHYPDELQTAKITKMVRLVEHAFERAFENDTVLMFMLKTYCGYRETGPTDVQEDQEVESLEINFRVAEPVKTIRTTKGK